MVLIVSVLDVYGFRDSEARRDPVRVNGHS